MSKEVIAVKGSMKLRELLEIFKNFHIFPLVPYYICYFTGDIAGNLRAYGSDFFPGQGIFIPF